MGSHGPLAEAQLLASDKTAVGQSLMQCQNGSTVSRRERPLMAESGLSFLLNFNDLNDCF